MPTTTLKTYTATLRHAGNMLHEVPITGDYVDGIPVGISERELRFLKHLHGSENIVNVKQVGTVEVDEQEHYFHIAERYGSHEDFTKQDMVKQKVERLFGIELDGFHEWLTGKIESQAKVNRPLEGAAGPDLASIRAEIEAKVRAEMAAQAPQAPAKTTLGLPKQPAGAHA